MSRFFGTAHASAAVVPTTGGSFSAIRPRTSSSESRRGVFIDVEDLKEKVRQSIIKKQYDVRDFYKTKGVSQWIARQQWFEDVTLLVTCFNALWIAIDTDNNKSKVLLDAHWVFILAENVFCLYFGFEWLVRFLAFERKANCVRDGAFVLDTVLCAFMVLETWVMAPIVKFTSGGSSASLGDASILRTARVLRYFRMSRMLRLIRGVPELMILIKGVAIAARSVLVTFLMMLLLLYVFAIFFTQLSEDNEGLLEHYDSIPLSMYTLFIYGVFLDDLASMMDLLKEESMILLFLFFLFTMLGAVTLMNMLIGVICDVITSISTVEKEELRVSFVKVQLQKILFEIFPHMQGQEASDVKLSQQEYHKLIEDKQAAKLLHQLGVDVVGLVDFAEMWFEQEEWGSPGTGDSEMTVSFGELMESMLELRGSNIATVRDIMNLRKFVRGSVDARLDKIQGLFAKEMMFSIKKVLSSANARDPGGKGAEHIGHVVEDMPELTSASKPYGRASSEESAQPFDLKGTVGELSSSESLPGVLRGPKDPPPLQEELLHAPPPDDTPTSQEPQPHDSEPVEECELQDVHPSSSSSRAIRPISQEPMQCITETQEAVHASCGEEEEREPSEPDGPPAASSGATGGAPDGHESEGPDSGGLGREVLQFLRRLDSRMDSMDGRMKDMESSVKKLSKRLPRQQTQTYASDGLS